MYMRPTFRQLQYIVAVADTGRVGLAADKLGVSQPSLSAQLAEAEESLAARLFERGRSGARLTPVGQEVVRRARKVLSDMDDLRAVTRAGGAFLGRLRLGVLPTVGPYLLPEATRDLHATYPELRLLVREEPTMDLEQGLVSGRFDMVISTPEDHPGTTSLPILEETLWAAFAADDPLSRTTGPVEPSEMKDRLFLTLGTNHRLARMVAALASEAGGQVSEEYEGTSLDAIRIMAATGAGVAILPSLYALAEAKRGTEIVLREISSRHARRTIALVARVEGALSREFTGVAEALSKVAQRLTISQSS